MSARAEARERRARARAARRGGSWVGSERAARTAWRALAQRSVSSVSCDPYESEEMTWATSVRMSSGNSAGRHWIKLGGG